jgi:hypothetical protein
MGSKEKKIGIKNQTLEEKEAGISVTRYFMKSCRLSMESMPPYIRHRRNIIRREWGSG